MNNSKEQKFILLWLSACFLLVVFMVVLGGYTRLTESGLSIVEWQLVKGVFPPFSKQAWLLEFNKYKLSPEFKYINFSMTIADFKRIFYVEYFHRLLGRLVGVVFFVPFLYFIFLKKLNSSQIKKLLIVGFLIIVQGIIGWYMVKSGLVDKPAVSQYRLALHLMGAFAILAAISVVVFEIISIPISYNIPSYIKKYCFINLCIVTLQIFSGALVAGLDAGLIYNNFPFMGNNFLAPDIIDLLPRYINIFENPAMVQFNHRLIGMVVIINIIILHLLLKRLNNNSFAYKVSSNLVFLVLLQVVLGILTLLTQVLLVIALIHQAIAILVFEFTLLLFISVNYRGIDVR
jgi:heme a synthase